MKSLVRVAVFTLAMSSLPAFAGTIDVVLVPTVFGTPVSRPTGTSNVEESSVVHGGGSINLQAWATPSAATFDPNGNSWSGGHLVFMITSAGFGGIGPNPPRSVGVYAAAGSGICIDRIVVDPIFTWGIGDFTITTNAGGNAETVPLSGSALPFMSDVAGFGLWSRRRKAPAA